MISPARAASCAMSRRTSWTSSDSVSSRAVACSRRVACALLSTAVSGWFSSCAMAEAISPRVETRDACASCSCCRCSSSWMPTRSVMSWAKA